MPCPPDGEAYGCANPARRVHDNGSYTEFLRPTGRASEACRHQQISELRPRGSQSRSNTLNEPIARLADLLGTDLVIRRYSQV
jgi:hypothetical protein